MKKNLTWLPVVIACLLCCTTALAASTYDCDCTGIHMHLLPKSGNYGCFQPVCGKTHAHDYTEYTCFNLDEPSCGLPSKLHEVGCFTSAALAELRTYNRSFTLPTDKGLPNPVTPPYVFAELSTYQTSPHHYYNLTDDNDLTLQMFLLCNIEGNKPGDSWATQPANVRFYAQEDYDYNWTPAYCADEAIPVRQYSLYKRVNLEDSSYFDAEASARIRTVMLNSYPYYTMEEMQSRLAAAGIEDAQHYDEGVMIAATQLAVWNFTNGKDEPYDPDNYLDRMVYHYSKSTKRPSITAHAPTDSNLYYIPQDAERIEKMTDYLVSLAGGAGQSVSRSSSQVVITSAGVTDLAVLPGGENGALRATLRVNFDAPLRARAGEVLNVTATTDSGAHATAQIVTGRTCKIVLDGYRLGDAIDLEVDGYQYLDCGVYFFEPYIADGNVREHSQNLVGVSYGLTAVTCRVHLTPRNLTLQKVNHLGKALTDASFALYYVSPDAPDGKLLIGTYPVDDKGQISLTNLLAGATYELQEVQAPAGYTALDKPVRFSVLPGDPTAVQLADAGETASLSGDVLTIVNRPAVPATGDGASPALWALLALAALLCAALLRKASRA